MPKINYNVSLCPYKSKQMILLKMGPNYILDKLDDVKSKNFIIKTFFKINFCISFIAVGANDVILNSIKDTIWTSTIFSIPSSFHYDQYGFFCEKKSFYYCLLFFKNEQNGSNLPAIEHQHMNSPRIPRIPYRGLAILKESAFDQFHHAIGQSYNKHNFYVIRDGCCQDQFISYFNFGFNEALLTPSEYYERITDYSEEGKQLNYLLAYYDIECEVNIITRIGYGKGPIKRQYLRYKYFKPASRNAKEKRYLFSL